MRKKKKTNPRRLPVSQADLLKAKKEAVNQAITSAFAMVFMALRDKEDYSNEDLQRIWNNVNDIAECVTTGRIDVKDCLKTLEDEAGIVFK